MRVETSDTEPIAMCMWNGVGRRSIGCMLAVGWMGAIGFSFHKVMAWEYGEGERPVGLALTQPAAKRPLLVVALHSQCPCSMAAMRNLLELPKNVKSGSRILLLISGPDSSHSPIVTEARRLPEAEVRFIDEKDLSKTYGARTSGQAFLYDRRGRLVFSGGLTSSRGNSGPCAGTEALRLVSEGGACPSEAPVYGCGLLTPGGRS